MAITNEFYIPFNACIMKRKWVRLLASCAISSLALLSCSPDTNAQKKANTMSNNPYYSRTDTQKLQVSDEEWKKVLSKEVYEIARNKGTEHAFSGKYYKTDAKGTYYCAACGNPLFRSGAKFASGCGWPSFYEALSPNSVRYEKDYSYGMQRIEVLCGRCDGHLGHIFDDGPAPSYKRFCMNSIVLDFEPDDSKAR